MSQPQKIDINEFMQALEEMMDSRDDMWYEQKYCNTNKFLYIKEHRYDRAKQKVRDYLERIFDTASEK
jgi:hypothetical protein